MASMNRREFMKRSAGSIATGMALANLPSRALGATKFDATAKRTLGKTGIQCSLLGIGTGTKAWNGSSEQNRKGRKAFVSLLEHAYASGIRYYDMADMYGAHDYMKDAQKNSVKREECVYLTKTVSRDPDLIKADLERFRRELDTNYLDIVLLHCLTDGDWTTKLKPCMDVLEEAKSKGIIRAHGVSCHNIDAMRVAAASPWTDVMLSRINPFGVKMDGTPEEIAAILQTAHKNGVGNLGMKIAGEGETKDRIPESLKFVLGLGCVDALNIGCVEQSEIDSNVGHIASVAA